MKNKAHLLSCLIFLIVGVTFSCAQGEPKKDTHNTSFSGEWKAKESLSIGGNILCSYVASDRMRSKIMKIIEKSDFLTIENPDPTSEAPLVNNLEKLIFDGKTRQISHSQDNEKKCFVNMSKDGHTMTINSIVYFTNGAPNHERMQAFTSVKEVWNLSKDGKSISILAKATSNIWGKERSWEIIFNKVN